mgnify:CR=1 FL=1
MLRLRNVMFDGNNLKKLQEPERHEETSTLEAREVYVPKQLKETTRAFHEPYSLSAENSSNPTYAETT